MFLILLLLQIEDPVQYVDPFIGSGGHGHVFVGASVPFGMVQVGPNQFNKGWDWCSGYHYSDPVFKGFSQTHLSGTGIGDLGDILIMPYFSNDIVLDKGNENQAGSGYSSRYSHAQETVIPGYYTVTLSDSGIKVELAATERVGFHTYHFPAKDTARIIVDLTEGNNDATTGAGITQVDSSTFTGYRISNGWGRDNRVNFAIKTSIPILDARIFGNNKLVFSFAQNPGDISLKVGISPVSEANALLNIEAEIPHWDIQQVVKEARVKWNAELSKIEVETTNETLRQVLYTSIYHAVIHPCTLR